MRRHLAGLLATALVLMSPGLGAYDAVAAGFAVSASQSVAVGATGAQAGAATVGLHAPGSAGLSMPMGSTGLGSAIPTLNAPLTRPGISGATPLVSPALRTPAGISPVSTVPESLPHVSKAALPATTPKTVSRAVTRSGLVQQAGRIRKVAAQDRTGVRASSSISRFFDGTPARRAAESGPVLGRQNAGRQSGLRSRSSETKGRNAAVPQPDKPKRGLKRSYKVGLVGAAVGLTFTLIIPAIAAALGYDFHSNYAGPSLGEGASIVGLVRLVLAVVVMAPIAEEVIFRGGILGGLTGLGKKIAKNKFVSFWLPAVISAVIFAVVHETADPVLLTARTLGALVFAWVYHKEGIHASIAMHGFNNAFAMSGLVGYALFGPVGATVTTLGMLLIGGIMIWRSARSLNRQKEDRKAGRIQPYPLTYKSALVLAAILVFGVMFVSLSPLTSVLWMIGAGALFFYAGLKKPKPHAAP
ncbi:lysostaphin resistance A-like protein [Elusimicrobiota bacterium]